MVVADDLSLPKIRPPIDPCDSGEPIGGSIVPTRRTARVRWRYGRFKFVSTRDLGRIAPRPSADLLVARCARKIGNKHNDPSRPLLRDSADDRLQGDPFIQLFLFQRAMMNGEAAQLAI